MEKEVKKLISLEAEGGYWDFKEKWHSNNSDLLHDIIYASLSSMLFAMHIISLA